MFSFCVSSCGTNVKHLLQKDAQWMYQSHSESEMEKRDIACSWLYEGFSEPKSYWDELECDFNLFLASLYPYDRLQECENALK